MINHMVSDPVRAITQVKRGSTKVKYESTYLDAFENLVPFGSDKIAYEKRVEEIIKALKGKREYFVAAFPFYNSQNSQVYTKASARSGYQDQTRTRGYCQSGTAIPQVPILQA